jgi:hypothetical protein
VPFGELAGPEKVEVWEPVNPVAKLPYGSLAVIDTLKLDPAMAVVGAETSKLNAAAAPTDTSEDVP